MKTNTRGRKGPPKSFDSLRAAKEALANLADSLATHSFSWPAAAFRSYLAGGSSSLDEAFGLSAPTAKAPPKAKKTAKKKAVAPSRSARQRR